MGSGVHVAVAEEYYSRCAAAGIVCEQRVAAQSPVGSFGSAAVVRENAIARARVLEEIGFATCRKQPCAIVVCENAISGARGAGKIRVATICKETSAAVVFKSAAGGR